jgi:hypothetical protein
MDHEPWLVLAGRQVSSQQIPSLAKLGRLPALALAGKSQTD